MQHRTGSNKWRKKVNGQLPIVGLPGKQLLKPDVSEWLEVWGWTPGSDCFFTPEKPHFMCRAIYEVVGASKWCHNILMSSQYIDVPALTSVQLVIWKDHAPYVVQNPSLWLFEIVSSWKIWFFLIIKIIEKNKIHGLASFNIRIITCDLKDHVAYSGVNVNGLMMKLNVHILHKAVHHLLESV